MKWQKGNAVEEFVFILLLCGVFGIVALIAKATSNEDSAIAAAITQGYSDLSVKSVNRFISAEIHGCDDWKATAMNATNPVGKKVEIIVCEGLFMKGATIRSK